MSRSPVVAQFEVLPKQAELIECEERFCAGYGGRGSGKTHAAQWKMWGRLRKYPRAAHYVIGGDYEQLRRGYFLDFRNFLEDMLRWKEGVDFRYVDTPRPEIRLLDTKARLRALSADIADRIRSTQLQSVHLEEPQTWGAHGEAVWRTLLGSLRHNVRSQREHPDMLCIGWLTFNPGGNPGAPQGSWLHKLITEEFPKYGYPSWRFSLRDNHLLFDQQAVIRNMEMGLPEDMWPVEIDGEWPTTGGDVYRGFDARVHCVEHDGLPPIALDPQKPILWSLDFNVGWMASVIAQSHKQQQIVSGYDRKPNLPPEPITANAVPGWQRYLYIVLDEIFLRDSGMPEVVDEFLARYGDIARRVGVRLYGDPSGGGRSQLASGSGAIRTNWQYAEDGLKRAGIPYEIHVMTHDRPQMERVYAVRSAFRTGAGYGLLVDRARCENLIRDFQSVRFKPGTNEIEKDNRSEEGLKRTHLSDALGYLLYVEQCYETQKSVDIRADFMIR